MSACRPTELDDYLRGELEPRSDAGIAEHLRTCARCSRELAWLRAEHRVFAERGRVRRSPLPDFDAVLARAAQASPPCFDPRPWLGRAALGMCAAAALFAVIRQPGASCPGAEPGIAPPASETIVSGSATAVSVGTPHTPSPSARIDDEALDGEPLASEEHPRMTCRDTATSPTDETRVAAAESASPAPTSQPAAEDKYGACSLASPASRPTGAAICSAPQL